MGLNKSKINLIVVTQEPFPVGMAATNRIHSWVKELSRINCNVKVFILRPTEKKEQVFNKNYNGNSGSIRYEYLSKKTIWDKEKSKFHKIKVLLYSHIVLIKRIISIKPEIIVIYSKNIFTKFLIYFISRFLNFNYYIEETEYPKILKEEKGKLINNIHFMSYRLANGMVVMTDELYHYYRSLGVRRIFILPMTVDFSRFNNIKQLKQKVPYFLYIGGSGGIHRDGLFELIEGFNMFLKINRSIRLKLVGPISKNKIIFLKIIKYIEENKIGNYIDFEGVIPSIEIPSILINCLAVFITPNTNFDSGGFPTKLGEYLASSRPVVCSKVASITKYLDNSSSILVNPGDSNDIFFAMKFISKEGQKVDKIGKKGYQFAFSNFNAANYSVDLLTFLKD